MKPRRRIPVAGISLATLTVIALVATGCSWEPTATWQNPDSGYQNLDRLVEEDYSDQALRREVRSRVLRVRSLGCDGLVTGSGFLASPTLVVTNRHVVAGWQAISLNTWDGELIKVAGVTGLPGSDLAVLTLEQPQPGSLPRAVDKPRTGEGVWAVGYPSGGRLAFTPGEIVDEQDGGIYGEAFAVLRATPIVTTGNSGGPLLDRQGRLLGVVFAREQATGYALAIDPGDLDALVAAGDGEPVVGCEPEIFTVPDSD